MLLQFAQLKKTKKIFSNKIDVFSSSNNYVHVFTTVIKKVNGSCKDIKLWNEL